MEGLGDRVRAAIGTADNESTLLRVLESDALDLIEHDLVHRLVPDADRLIGLDYSGHPLAGLVAGVAVAARHRRRGREILSEARVSLERHGTPTEIEAAYFLEGLEDLAEGDLASAERWWTAAEELATKTESVGRFGQVHLCLPLLERGELLRASFVADQAVHGARRRHDARIEMLAHVYSGLIRYWRGDFAGMERSAEAALAAATSIPNPLDRYEEPLAYSLRAAAATFRSAGTEADEDYDRALATAGAMTNDWYRAIILTLRAVTSAPDNPLRAIRYAAEALDFFGTINEKWWSSWALEATVIARRVQGDHGEAIAAGRELLASAERPLERGRALIEVATALRLGQGVQDEVTALLTEATELLEAAGARYLAARAALLLAETAPDRAAYLLRRVMEQADGESHPAWTSLVRGPRVDVRLFGTPEVRLADRAVRFATRYDLEVVALLALAGPKGRAATALTEAVWPGIDPQRSAHRLDVSLSRLRHLLLPSARLRRTRVAVVLDLDPTECDVTRALATLAAARAAGAPVPEDVISELERPLLEGSASDWVVEEESRLRVIARRAARSDS